MKEPENLAEQLHVLTLITGRTYIITREQCVMITKAQNDGNYKTVSIGNCPITLHQIADMPTLDVYRRQMKTKLAMQHQRMCKRCGNILAIQDFCGCKDRGELPIMGQAAKENPKLKEFLIATKCEALMLPEPKVESLPEAPPTPKEKHQIKVIQGYKDAFLGKAPMPLPDCDTCKNERRYVFEGVMIKCECTMRKSNVSGKPFRKVDQSGTLPATHP